jgi:hypothetical protein
MDAGRFDEIAVEVFSADARFVVGPPGVPTLGAAEMVAAFKATTIRYPGGTLRTRHLITNPVVEVDEEAGEAACRSCYTVLQQTEVLPLQVILCGRYPDRFARVGGSWRLVERDYTQVDLVGDTSQHVRYRMRPAPAGEKIVSPPKTG